MANNRLLIFKLITAILGSVIGVDCLRAGFHTDQPMDAASPRDLPSRPDHLANADAERLFGPPITGSGSLVANHDITSYLGNYAVVWAGYLPNSQEYALQLTIISAQGEVISPSQSIHPLTEDLSTLKVFSSDKGITIFYQISNSSVLYFTRQDLDGGKLMAPSKQRQLGTYTNPQFFPTTTGFGIVFSRYILCPDTTLNRHMIHIGRISTQGVILGNMHLIQCSSTTQNYASAIETGTGLVVVWTESNRVAITTLDQNFDLIREPASLGDSVDNKDSSIVALDDGRLVASWHTEDRIAVLALNPDTTPYWPSPLIVNQPNQEESLDSSLAGARDHALVVWESDGETALTQITYKLLAVTESAVNPAPFLLTDTRYAFHVPRIARGPEGLGIIFKGAVNGTHGLFFHGLEEP